MNKNTEQLVDALIRVCVFVHTSRNWEDYENMYLDNQALDAMTNWVASTLDIDKDSIVGMVDEISKSQFTNFKTDWSIACIQVTNVISLLNSEDKLLVQNYIKDLVHTTLKDDAGVTKAIDKILAKL